jgi:hypothetical protein
VGGSLSTGLLNVSPVTRQMSVGGSPPTILKLVMVLENLCKVRLVIVKGNMKGEYH